MHAVEDGAHEAQNSLTGVSSTSAEVLFSAVQCMKEVQQDLALT